MEISEINGQDPHSKAVALAESGDEAKAYAAFASILKDNFNDARALYGLAQLYRRGENFGLAFNLYRAAAGILGKSAACLNGMGLCHEESWDLDAAEKCFLKAIEADKNSPEAYSNLGMVKLLRCEPKKALEYLETALTVDPDFAAAKHHKSYSQLMLQQWAEGWDGHAEILGKVKTRTERFYEGDAGLLPRWDGTPKKRVLVYGEQGIGDEICFASCVPDLIRASESVVFDCDHRLEGLFKRSFGAVVHGTRFKTPDWLGQYPLDARVAIGDLPKFFRRTDSAFTGEPYLKADPERVLQWKALFDTFPKPVIGVAWNGGLPNTGSERRSLSATDMLPILKATSGTWISLEYKHRAEDIEFFLSAGVNIRTFDRYTKKHEQQDYDDVAAIVEACDMVVSVTTAVVHLSGALGKECFCLVPEKPRWLYGLEGELPWYRSVSLFRQRGDWPIKTLADMLKLRFGESSPGNQTSRSALSS